jgi:hypothetical protein
VELTRKQWLVPICVLLFASGSAYGQQIAISGKVLTPDGAPVAGAVVSAYRQGTPTTGRTSAAGVYRVELAAGTLIDYIIFEHSASLPRVIEGPLPGSLDSTINVVLMASSIRGMSLSATLGTIHAIQFLRIVGNRSDVGLPGSLTIPPQLKVAAESITTATGQDTARGQGNNKPGLAQPKSGLWPMDDPFFAPAAREK